MAASSVGSETEFVTSNLYKCSKCVFTTSSVEEIKTHIASCNASNVSEVPIPVTMENPGPNAFYTVLVPVRRPPNGPTVTVSSTGFPVTAFHWGRDATLLLIDLYKEHLAEFTRSLVRIVWQKISDRMKESGWMVTGMQCTNKLKGMKRQYLNVKKENQHRTKAFGKDNISIRGRKAWEFFSEMDEVAKLEDKQEKEQVGEVVRAEDNDEEGYTYDVSLLESFSAATFSGVRDEPLPQSTTDSDSSDSDGGRKGKRRRRDRGLDDPPSWFLKFAEDCQERHEKRMATADRLMTMLEKFADTGDAPNLKY